MQAKLLMIVTLIIFSVKCKSEIEFNRNFTGVTFTAYTRILNPRAAYQQDHKSLYKRADVKAMIKVISKRFSRVATFDVGSMNVGYHENFTYFQQSYAQVYSAEVAALLNAEEKRLALTIFVGVWLYDFPRQQMDTELNLAFESSKIANSIYPGTVTGLVFSENSIATNIRQANLALERMQSIKEKAKEINLKIGIRQNCKSLMEYALQGGPVSSPMTEIVKLSDFIICTVVGSDYDFSLGPTIGFQNVKRDLIQFRDSLKEMNPAIEVMCQTGYSTVPTSSNIFGSTSSMERNLQNLKSYWQLVDEWAAANSFPVWMFEAFDNPWKRLDGDVFGGHYGWWKLRSNLEVDIVDGYHEKVADLSEMGSREGRTDLGPEMGGGRSNRTRKARLDKESGSSGGGWLYAAIAIGVIVSTAVIVQLLIVYIRYTKLKREILTKDEINQFLFGNIRKASLVAESADYPEMGQAEMEAINRPYDRSYEISKDNFMIVWNSPLGSGQFGNVYKAILRTPGECSVEVALKMAKSGCSKYALTSLLGEIKILTHLGEHRNLVSIKGAYTAEMQRGIVYVATELCALGSLKMYLTVSQKRLKGNMNSYTDLERLQQDSEENVDEKTTTNMIPDMIRWAYEIANAMEYLSSKNVVHADLATRNVLLTADKTAKITDFGLSRRLYEYSHYIKTHQEPLPWRWMSIEALKKLHFSSQSDVWSLGVTLWEIFSYGDIPYPGMSWTLDFVSRLENGLRLECPQYASEEMYKIMKQCWESDPGHRPLFSQLKLYIKNLIDEDNQKLKN